MQSKPLTNSYWVVPGRFLAGEYPRTMELQGSIERVSSLVSSGITRFIDLTTPEDRLTPYALLLPEQGPDGRAVQRMSFPITDVSVPESPKHLVDILDAVDEALLGGHGVYVHCWGGIGRTGVVVGCWLKRHFENGMIRRSPESSLAGLSDLWRECPKSAWKPASPETREQYDYILDWHEMYDPSNDVTRKIRALLDVFS